MTRRQYTTYGVIAAFAAIATLFLVNLFSNSYSWSPAFPRTLDPRVFMPDESSKIRFRFEHYEADRTTRSFTEVEYKDGTSEVIRYWPNNYRRSSEKRYPLPADAPAGSPRALRSTATYDAMGEKYTSHKLYRLDGTLERDGQLQKDGRYRTLYFWEDGKTVNRDRFFDNKMGFQTENVFDRDGTLLSTVTQIPGEDKRSTTFFYANGERRLTYTASLVGGLDGDFFSVDGKVVSEFHRDHWTTQQAFYDSEGRIVEVKVSVKMTSATAIRLFNSDGSPRAIQSWRNKPAREDKPAQNLLRSVDDYCKPKHEACRSIQMSNDGSYPEVVLFPWNNGSHIVKHLKPDGTVLSVERVDTSGKKVSLPAQGKEVFDPVLFLEPHHDITLPELNDETAPPYVYDYE